ncbi:MAG: hypothetical protein HY996_12335 [Micrococcales bacterium]|nr:hypothetical protein [Micrococcales bacterium]
MPPPSRRAALALGAASALGVALSGCGALAQAPRRIRSAQPVLPPTPLVMAAFQPDYADPARIDASAAGLDTVIVASIALINGGADVTPTNPRVLRQRDRAKQLGKTATVMLTNSVPGVGFSGDLASGTLRSAANRARIVEQLARKVADESWDGIMLDLESLDRGDATGYVRFAKALRARLGKTVRLDASIMTATSRDGYLGRGYDVEGLTEQLDLVTLMGYDQHGTWDPTNPGPVGSLDWQRACLDALLKLAPSRQVDLGVAGYGYRWAPDRAHAVSDAQARRLVAEDPAATVRWDDTAREWNATLSDGSTMWWSDATSLAARRRLATELRLHGIAVWSLAVSDPIQRPPA